MSTDCRPSTFELHFSGHLGNTHTAYTQISGNLENGDPDWLLRKSITGKMAHTWIARKQEKEQLSGEAETKPSESTSKLSQPNH